MSGASGPRRGGAIIKRRLSGLLIAGLVAASVAIPGVALAAGQSDYGVTNLTVTPTAPATFFFDGQEGTVQFKPYNGVRQTGGVVGTYYSETTLPAGLKITAPFPFGFMSPICPLNGPGTTVSSSLGDVRCDVTVNPDGTTVIRYTITATGGIISSWVSDADQVIPVTATADLQEGAEVSVAVTLDPSVTSTNPPGLNASAPVPVAVAPAQAIITTPTEGARLTTHRPEITGTATPGTTLNVINSANQTTLCTVDPVPTNGNWACTPTADIPDGTHTITATVTNEFDRTSTSNPRTFSIGTAAPAQAIITTPTEGARLTTHRPEITGTATPGTTLNVINSANQTTLCTVDPVPANGNWACTPTADIPDGTHTITATVTNEFDRTSASNPRTFSIGTAVPVTPTPAPPTPVTPSPVIPTPAVPASPTLANTGTDGAMPWFLGAAALILAGAIALALRPTRP